MKKIALLGATGSIGGSALDVIARHPDRFTVSVLSADSSVDELLSLCRRFRPAHAVISNQAHYPALRDGLAAAGLPKDQRTRAIVIGVIVATVLRIVFALAATKLAMSAGSRSRQTVLHQCAKNVLNTSAAGESAAIA